MSSSNDMDAESDNDLGVDAHMEDTGDERSNDAPVGGVGGDEGNIVAGSSNNTGPLLINELLCYVQYHIGRTTRDNIHEVLNRFIVKRKY